MMDPRGNIYSGPDGDIPDEHKARLEGYLRGREESDLLKDTKAAFVDREAKDHAISAGMTEQEIRDFVKGALEESREIA